METLHDGFATEAAHKSLGNGWITNTMTNSIRFLSFLLALGCSIATAQTNVSTYRPNQFLWGDYNGNYWNSFASYEADLNAAQLAQYSTCMANATANQNGSCFKSIITGSDPYIGAPFEVYYNGQSWENWLRLTQTTTYIQGGVVTTSDTLIANGGLGDQVAFANPICPAQWNLNSALQSGPDPQARYYSVTCTDNLELACPVCEVGSVNSMAAPPLVGNPINPANMEKTQNETDYSIEAGRLAITRSYRSGLRRWSEYIPRLLDFSSLRPASFPAQSRTFTLSPNGVTYFPMSFELRPSTTLSEVDLTRVDGTRAKLYEGAPGLFATTDSAMTASRATSATGVAVWLVRTASNSMEIYAQSDGTLLSIVQPDGYELDYSYPQANSVVVISRLSARSIALTLTADGALQKAVLPDGRSINYGEATGLYSSVQYQDNAAISYSYDEAAYVGDPVQPSTGLLTGLTDELGKRLATYTYDRYGEAIATERAGGVNRFQLSPFTITDPLGVSLNFWLYAAPDGSQRLSRVSQPPGSGSDGASKTFGYDANGNLTSIVDFNGNQTCLAADLTRGLEAARVEGVDSSASCAALMAASAPLPADARKISSQWHPDWRFVTARAEPLKISYYVYNGQPDPTNGGAIASCASGAQLPDGKPIVVACKQVEQATTDGDGHLAFGASLQSGVASKITQWTYNANGQVLSEKGPRTDVSQTMTFTYYATTTANYTKGDLSQVSDPLGRITRYSSYDKNGQVLQSSDPNGIVTVNTYDARLRLTGKVVGGLSTTITYDAAGQIKVVALPDSTSVSYAYDDAHRLVRVNDPAGHSIIYTLDNRGDRINEQVNDASGNLTRTVTRVFDALRRLQQVTGASQ